jgi:ABC-2 type transport system ATP-binding protein
VVELRVPDADRARTLDALRNGIGDDPTVDEHDGRVVLTAPDGARTLTVALRRLEAAGITPQDAALRKPTLDEVFLALTGHQASERGNRRGRHVEVAR